MFLLLILNWQMGGLRFTSVRLNFLVLTLAFLLPAYGLVATLHGRRGYGRTVALLTLFPVASFSLLFFFGSLFLSPTVLFEGRSLSEPLRMVPVGGSKIVAYRGSPGAMSSFSMSVCLETPIVSGLKWVRPLHNLNPADDVRIDVLDRHHARLTYPDRHSKYYPDDPVVVTVPIR